MFAFVVADLVFQY